MTTVSVIIPAYNASATIDATLASVRSQSWRDLDIIVVDDGSSDDTAERVLAHCRDDERVRLLRLRNSGVAVARNTAIHEARGDYIAPIDADDLWHERKIELQMAKMMNSRLDVGLVYCWFLVIDELDRIVAYGNRDKDRGNVLRRMCLGNLVGSGSAPLMRKSAILEAGGYDDGLLARGAQGCEDLKLYFAIAERYDFEAVPAYLVGYRATPQSMSSDAFRMLRSYDFVMLPNCERYPQHADQFARGRALLTKWLLERAISYGTARQALDLFAELRRQSPLLAVKTLGKNGTLLRRRFISRPPRYRFGEWTTATGQGR